MSKKSGGLTVGVAVGQYSQWAAAYLHPRSARSLVDRLTPLVTQAGGVAMSSLTEDMLTAAITGPHPERVILAQHQFLEFCQAQGWVIAVPPMPRTPDLVTPAEWQALMVAIPGNHWYSARDRLVFHLLYIIGLPLEDIRLLSRWTLTPSQVRYDGQWVPLPEEVESAVLEWYGCRFGYGSNPVFINPSANPDPLLVRTLNRHLKRYCFIAGITPIITVAKLRATGRVHGLLARPSQAHPMEPDASSGTGLLGLFLTATPSGDLL